MQTTCSECGTAFRVAPAELAHRRGWVRCGRCGAPFDALATLADEPPGLRVASLSQTEAEAMGQTEAHNTVQTMAQTMAQRQPAAGAITQTPTQALEHPAPDQRSSRAPAAHLRSPSPDAQRPADNPASGSVADPPPQPNGAPGFAAGAAPASPTRSTPLTPRAGQAATLIWGLGALLALLLLAAQWALLLRLPLVAWWPASGPVIHSLCTAVACPPLENRWAEAVPGPLKLAHLEVRETSTDPHGRTLHIRVRNEAPWTLPEPAFIATLQTPAGRHTVFIPPTGGASELTDLAPAEQRYRRLTLRHPNARDFAVSVRPVPALEELTGLQQDPIRLP